MCSVYVYLRPANALGREIRKHQFQGQFPKPISRSPSAQGAGAGPLLSWDSVLEKLRGPRWRGESEPSPTPRPQLPGLAYISWGCLLVLPKRHAGHGPPVSPGLGCPLGEVSSPRTGARADQGGGSGTWLRGASLGLPVAYASVPLSCRGTTGHWGPV